MADKAIGDLPQAASVNDDSLLAVEQQGIAMKMTGAQFKQFARQAADPYVQIAVQAAQDAESARDSIVLDEEQLAQAVADADGSAELAALSEAAAANSALLSESWAIGGTGIREEEDVNNSKYWADKAQAEADRASVPALEGVYNIILVDRITLQKYALLVEGKRLKILGVSDEFTETEMTLIDVQTGLSYNVVVDNGEIGIEEV